LLCCYDGSASNDDRHQNLLKYNGPYKRIMGRDSDK